MDYEVIPNTQEFKTVLVNKKEQKIPIDWDVKNIGSLFTNSNSVFTDGDWIEKQDISSEGILYLTSGNVGNGKFVNKGKRFISNDTSIQLKCTFAYPGDMLFSRLNTPQGRVCIIPDIAEKYVVAVDNVIARPDDIWNRQYLLYVLQQDYYLRFCAKISTGTTMKRISRKKLEKVEIFLSKNQEEQKLISDYLSFHESIVNNLDRLIELTEARLRYYTKELTSGRKRIKIQDGKPTLYENTEFKTVLVNKKEQEIPVDWDVQRLGDIYISFDNKRTPINASSRESKKGIYPYYGANNIVDYLDFYSYDGEFILLGEDGAPFMDKTKKVSFLINGRFSVNNHCHVFKMKNKYNAPFFSYSLNIFKYNRFVNGTTRMKLTKSSMETMEIAFPSNQQDQKLIADYLDEISLSVDYLKGLRDRQAQRLKWNSNALLSGKYVLSRV